jgi:GxxExxY protein
MDDYRTKSLRDDLSGHVIGACVEVHRWLGPGLLESAYAQCLAYELTLRGLRVQRERACPINYKGLQLETAHRMDIVVNDRLIVEVKSVERLQPIHIAQTVTYLKLTGLEVALLVNFNVAALKNGLRRLTRPHPEKNPLL